MTHVSEWIQLAVFFQCSINYTTIYLPSLFLEVTLKGTQITQHCGHTHYTYNYTYYYLLYLQFLRLAVL